MGVPDEPLKDQTVYQACETSKFTYKNVSRSNLSQVLATLIQNWLLLDLGMQLAMPALVLAALHNQPNEELCMNDEQASWFGSILFFSHPVGSLISGFLQEQFGRKGSMILVNIPIFGAWTTLYLANSISSLYVVSLTMGLCVGFCEAPLHSYIGEVGEPHLRGTLSTISSSAAIFGVLVEYIIGFFFDWRTAALISCSVPIITLICMTQIPESPSWLILKGRQKQAQKSLSWLRGWVDPIEVQNEFDELLSYTKVMQSANVIEKGSKYEMVPIKEKEQTVIESKSYLRTKYEELTDKKLLRPLRMVFATFIFCHATALLALRPYLVGVFNEFGFSIDSKLILVLVGLFSFVGTLLNIVFLRRLGKRRLTLLCQIVCTVTTLLLGVYCSIFNRSNSTDRVTWIPLVLFAIGNFSSGFSIILLPWQLISEVFPLKGRGAAGGISAAWAYYVNFAMTKTYLYLERWIKLSGIFYFYGILSVFGFVYFYYYLPETEGKSLEKIESYFTKNHEREEKFSKLKTKK